VKAIALVVLGTSVAAADPDPAPAIKLGGYVEVYSAFNTNEPDNGVTNLRAFDDRNASFVLQNVMLEGTWTQGPVSGRLALQAGDAGDLYYQSEPVHPPVGSAPATGPEAFRHIQEAYFAWAAPDRIELAAGVFLSPIGPETVAEHSVWNWSRSNLFFALPFYHTGVRFKRPLGDSGWSVIAMVANGWNSIVDNNHTPSVDVIAAYSKGDWLGQVQYFGGVETTSWRHLFDAYVQGPLAPHLTFLVHGDAGFEPGASWAGGAGYLKLDVTKQWAAVVRGDYLHDTQSILLPVEWVASGTATAQYQPTDGLLFRLEVRHDQAASDAYFSGSAVMPASRHQDTVTVGATAWF
jgi:hypothetical protein